LSESSGDGDISRFREREMLTLQRYGPAGYRLFKLAIGLPVLVLFYVTTLILTTLTSFYQGTSSIGTHGPTERTVQAEVQDCRRTGLVSDMGIGYWSVCRARVTTDHGVVEAVLDRSIATSSDIGRTITLAEACRARGCDYGKAVGFGWKFYKTAVWLIGILLRLTLAIWAFFYLSAALLGVRRFLVFGAWIMRKAGQL
jgi:hypothetical protein